MKEDALFVHQWKPQKMITFLNFYHNCSLILNHGFIALGVKAEPPFEPKGMDNEYPIDWKNPLGRTGKGVWIISGASEWKLI